MQEKGKQKTLYFMGMGLNFYNDEMKGSDIGNYRIRTTFKDYKGNVIFVEFSSGYTRQWQDAKGKTLSKPIIIDRIALVVEHLYNKTLSDDENESHIKVNAEGLKYTKADIIKFIEDNFKVKFDDVVVLDRCLTGFDCKLVTGDEFQRDLVKEAKAREIKEYFDKFEKEVLHRTYSNNSVYWADETMTNLKVILRYNGYNDILIINPLEFKFNYQKPKGAEIV